MDGDNHLVGGWWFLATPLKRYDFASWDDFTSTQDGMVTEIPNINMGKSYPTFTNHSPPTSSPVLPPWIHKLQKPLAHVGMLPRHLSPSFDWEIRFYRTSPGEHLKIYPLIYPIVYQYVTIYIYIPLYINMSPYIYIYPIVYQYVTIYIYIYPIVYQYVTFRYQIKKHPMSEKHAQPWNLFFPCFPMIDPDFQHHWQWFLNENTSSFLSLNIMNIGFCPFHNVFSQHILAGWWFEPLWKILVNWDDYSQY